MNLLTATWAGIIALLMWFPLPGGGVNPLAHTDLIIHFGLFLVFGHLLFHAVRPDDNRFYWIDWATILLVVAIGSETGQFFLATRSVSGLDYVINLVGGISGGALCFRTTPIIRWARGSLTGFTALVVGFTGTLWGGELYRAFLSTGTVTIPAPVIAGGIITGVVLLYVLVKRSSRRIKWQDVGTGFLVLLIVIYSFVVSPSLGFVVFVAGIGIPASTYRAYLAGLETIPWLLLLMIVGGLVLSPQYYLDNFGMVYVVASCLAVIKTLVVPSSPHSPEFLNSTTRERTSAGQAY